MRVENVHATFDADISRWPGEKRLVNEGTAGMESHSRHLIATWNLSEPGICRNGDERKISASNFSGAVRPESKHGSI